MLQKLYLSLLCQLLSLQKATGKFLFIISFLFCVFSLTMASQKAPVIWYFAGLFFVHLIINNKGKIPIRGSLKLAFVGLSILVCFYIVFMGVESPLKALTSIFSRAFGGSLGSAYFYLEYFPHEHDFLLGQSIKNPGGILPYQPFEITKELMNWRSSGLQEKNIIGSSPAVFWAKPMQIFQYSVFLLCQLLLVVLYIWLGT